MKTVRLLQAVLAVFCLLAAFTSAQAVTKTFTIHEPFGLAWGPDRVNYPVEFAQGAVAPTGVALADATGAAVPAQLSDIVYWPDRRTVKSATLSFMASLQPDETGTWTLTAGTKAVKPLKSDLTVVQKGAQIELTTSKVGIRLAGGNSATNTAVAIEQLPAPIQGVRMRDGRWVGKGWWQTDRPCLGYTAQVLERGPVFARVALRYTFTDNTAYAATVELSAGQDIAVISESFNMSEGKRYPMAELPGQHPGDTVGYVPPHFANAKEAAIWDWWGQTHGRVPSPNCYNFSLYPGLQPDSAEWNGYMYHEAAKAGDGGLTYDKDGRVTSLNAWLQWGQDESLYFGAYNAKQADEELAIIALRPGQWVHPDLEPHPIATLKQWTETNNLWIERRQSPDLFLRAPTCLGKRVYGIGVLSRQVVTDDKGNKKLASDIMLRHVRLGRCELDKVKDWVLDYPETSKYPRLFVDAGDLERMKKRAKENLGDLTYITWVKYLNTSDPQIGQQLIAECIKSLQTFDRTFATDDYGHMMYAINTGVIAHQMDIALAVPEITPEQRTKILHYAAANLYNSLSSDYVPPREAGFAWGSANMQAQLRARGALIAALLPNHPMGKAWRNYFADWLTAYTESQVNPAGATLECPGYGSMAIELGVVPMLALSRCGDVDLSGALSRYRAAAHERLSTLLPWDLRGGFRSAPSLGNTYYMPDDTLGIMAALFEDREPQLAAALRWGIEASGKAFGGHPTPVGTLLDPDGFAAMPNLGSESFPGMGFVMRNGFPRTDETYFLATHGSFEIGHGSNPGSYVLYAKGAPLCVDLASMYTPYFSEQWEHAGTISFNHDETVKPCPGRDVPGCYYTGKVWEEHKTEPFTCLEPGWDPQATLDASFGKQTRFATLPAAEYAEASQHVGYMTTMPYMLPETHGKLVAGGPTNEVWLKQPFTMTRRYVFVKSPDPLGPNYFVIRDDLAGNTELTPALNLWCMADKLDVNGPRVSYTGTYGVDLDCYVAEPTTFTARQHRLAHTSGFGFSSYYQQKFNKPFEEAQLLCQVPQTPGGGGYFVALVPRKHAEAAPTFATVLDGKGIQVTFPGRTDTIVLLNQPGDVELEGLTLHGTAFVVTNAAGKRTITLLAPGTVKQGEKVLLDGKEAATVEM